MCLGRLGFSFDYLDRLSLRQIDNALTEYWKEREENMKLMYEVGQYQILNLKVHNKKRGLSWRDMPLPWQKNKVSNLDKKIEMVKDLTARGIFPDKI